MIGQGAPSGCTDTVGLIKIALTNSFGTASPHVVTTKRCLSLRVTAQPDYSTDPPHRTVRMASSASIPRRAAAPMIDLPSANRSAAHADRNPPVTLRCVAVGHTSRSLELLSGGTSGCSRKIKQAVTHRSVSFSQSLAVRIYRRQPHDRVELAVQPRLIRAAVACGQHLAPSGHTQARSSSAFMRGANTVSPASMA
jgi:hypothetical protein